MTALPRILIVSHGLRIGGVERSLIGLLRALPPQAAEVDLLLYESGGELSTQVPKHVNMLPAVPALEALCWPIRKSLASRHCLVALARLAARLVIQIRSLLGLPPGFLLARSHRYARLFLPQQPGSYDLAISFLTPHDFVAENVSARRKVGWIHTDYTSVETGVAASFERMAWEQMDQIVAVSSEVAASFAKIFPSLAGRIVVIENVLDPAWIRLRAKEVVPNEMRLGAADVEVRLCTVGRFSYAKGIDIAVEAARLLLDHGIKFRWYVIGFGPEEALIRRKIIELGVEEVFVLLGSRENPYPYVAECDLYVQPSRYEGKSVSIREAQMLGKPVIVSEFPTVRSQVEHGVDGYIASPGAPALADAIRLLAGDAALRSRLAMTAAARDYGNMAEARKVLSLAATSAVAGRKE